MEMPKPVDPEVAAHERALREVGETMLMIEAAITRVDRALAVTESRMGTGPPGGSQER